MSQTTIQSTGENTFQPKKLLLAVLPYWAPVLPPVGLARLKAFLQPHGYPVKVVDMIVKNETLEFYYDYFDVLSRCVPPEKRGNFKNIGHDVLRNHMMAHLRYDDEAQYCELVKILVYQSYYVKISDTDVKDLNQILTKYYKVLEEYFLFLLKFETPQIVGLTVYRDNLAPSLFVLELTKKYYPEIKTIIGGGVFADSHMQGSPNFDALLAETRPYIDNIFIGEGELLLLKYLQNQLPFEQRVYTVSDIDGTVLDLKGMGPPDLSDLNLRKYSHLPATASFSCKYKCSFCNEIKFRGKYRERDIKETVDEMISLNNTLELNNVNSGHQLFFFTDSLINPILDKLAEELIRRNVSLYYDGYYKVDEVAADINRTFKWRESGLYRVRLGVESGSQKVLNLMHKGITVDQIRAAITGLAMAGIKTTTYWVIGHPGETEEDFQSTLDLVEELKNNIYQAECNPFLYHYSGQNDTDKWQEKRVLLYPYEARNMLVFDSWTLEIEPQREEAYDRMHRFVQHCQKLGIPNPYSLKESYDADKRWKTLQKFAVPPMGEFGQEGVSIKDNLNKRVIAPKTRKDDGEFKL